MEHVRDKATKLPEDGVPPEIVVLLPHDNDLDKIKVQKAATPVEGRGDLPQAAEQLARERPNAEVNEKSSYDDADVNAQRIAALHHLTEKLGVSVGLPSEQVQSPRQRTAAKELARSASQQGRARRRVASSDGQGKAAECFR